MKKRLAVLLAGLMALSLTASVPVFADEAEGADLTDLIAAAQEEGELTVCGSCEVEYLSAACAKFEKTYNIKTAFKAHSSYLPVKPLR